LWCYIKYVHKSTHTHCIWKVTWQKFLNENSSVQKNNLSWKLFKMLPVEVSALVTPLSHSLKAFWNSSKLDSLRCLLTFLWVFWIIWNCFSLVFIFYFRERKMLSDRATCGEWWGLKFISVTPFCKRILQRVDAAYLGSLSYSKIQFLFLWKSGLTNHSLHQPFQHF
jgi:hypothetical protein